jgi:serine/threonine protein kinase
VLNPGDKVNDYEIITPIRSGGMAMLYLARRRGVGGFNRLVALKLVHAHLTAEPKINRLFLQEARIAASVAHPNVVHVEEVGSADGKYFIAMEYVHGVSLDQFLNELRKQRRRMSRKLCVWIAAQISEALHAVHEATLENGMPLNIVHRDVSPQNVLISHTGHIKLIDFGIAKSQLMSYQASRGGSVLGKLRYMAPEQLSLQPVSRHTDVYALGVMLWEMLTARNLLRCFRIDDERDWTTRENPPAPSQYAPNLSAPLDQAVLKAIASVPEARYDNALAFRRALLRAESGASQVDAPAFAALIQQLIGDELARRRAAFPNEVNVQLASDVASAAEPSLNFEELTARLRPNESPETADEQEQEQEQDPDEPTRLAVSAWRAFNDDATVVRMASQARTSLPPAQRAPQTYIETFSMPASSVRPFPALLRKLRWLLKEQRTASVAALTLCMTLGAYLIALAPREVTPAQRGASAGHDQQPTRAGERASELDARPPLTLRETQIVSAAKARVALDAGSPTRLSVPSRSRVPAQALKPRKHSAPRARPNARIGKPVRPTLQRRRTD